MQIGFLSRRRSRLAAIAAAAVLPLALIGAGTAASASSGMPHAFKLSEIKHVWVIELENEGSAQTFGDPSADPYLASTLVKEGALIKNYYAVGHNSLDNYIAQISGQAPDPATDNDCGVWTKFTPGIKFGPRSISCSATAACIPPRRRRSPISSPPSI